MQSESIAPASLTPSLLAISEPSEAPTSLEAIGSSRAVSRASHLALPLMDEITHLTYGPKCGELFQRSDLDALSRKMLPNRLFFALGTNAERSEWAQRDMEYRPPQWVQRITGSASGWLPTPTAKANHEAPSMRKWPAYLAFQRWTGRKLTPELWEAMMGYPIGWTDLNASVIALSLRKPS